MTDYPITPSSELIRQWNKDAATAPMADQRYIAIQAALWGADQELEACCEWMDRRLFGRDEIRELRAARRPTPPSLKQQALEAQQRMWIGGVTRVDWETVRRALEALDD